MLNPVVAGLDGSRESLTAAGWAAREALRRGLPLRLVYAWEAGYAFVITHLLAAVAA